MATSQREIFIPTQQTPVASKQQDNRSSAQSPGPEHTDFSMYAAIGWILQGGVIISSAVIGVGLVLALVKSDQITSQRLLTFPHTLAGVWDGLLALHPQAMIVLGLLLLLATPIVRVLASIVAFALEHDKRYVVITTVVLLVLILSFLLGKGAG